MAISGSVGGVLIAIILVLLGILLISGILNFILWILGAICIVIGIVVGAMAIFGKKKQYY